MTRQPDPGRHPYRSGHCGTGGHDRCTGAYAGVACTCTCHERAHRAEEVS